MTALASVVVFCTTYVLILPALTLTVDEGWMDQLTEKHVYINCPGAAQYAAAKHVGTVPEDFGPADSGSLIEVDTVDVPMAEAPEEISQNEETSQVTQPSPTPETIVPPHSDPEISAQPEGPAEADSPEQPENPAEPETPVNPEQPIDPENPTDPEQPADPETPESTDPTLDPETPTDPEETDPEPAEPDSEIEVGENEIPKSDISDEEKGGQELPAEIEVSHEHTDECYDEDGNLICEQEKPSEELPEEIEAPHEHTDECYDEDGNLVCGYETEQPEQPKPVFSHIHTEECFELNEDDESVLICEEEGHVHTAEDCLDDNGELICGYEDFFPEDAKLVWVEVDKTFTFGITRYTVTGQIKLTKGMTQDDLFDALFSIQTYSVMPLSMSGESAEAAEDDKAAMLAAFAEAYGLSLTSMELVSGELPHTGGMGLAAWYTAGGVLIAAAGLTRRKAEEEI